MNLKAARRGRVKTGKALARSWRVPGAAKVQTCRSSQNLDQEETGWMGAGREREQRERNEVTNEV